MAYRRKIPRVKDLPFSQQLQKFCNAGVGCISFEPHYARSLQRLQLQESRGSASDVASPQQFVPSRLVRKGDVTQGVEPLKLPLPSHFIDPSENSDDFEPRSFYHIKDLKNEKTFDHKYFPRCGMTGLFFSREEIMDNLSAAAQDLKFSSPFWIRDDYAPLRSGYLSLKDGSEAVVVSLTSSVGGEEMIKCVKPELLHESLKKYLDSKSHLQMKNVKEDIPQGMNAISGYVSKNPFVQSLPNRGLWVSYDQLLYIEDDKSVENFADQFTLVEVDQWTLYNADQLTVPGRLGLKAKTKTSQKNIFQPLCA